MSVKIERGDKRERFSAVSKREKESSLDERGPVNEYKGSGRRVQRFWSTSIKVDEFRREGSFLAGKIVHQ